MLQSSSALELGQARAIAGTDTPSVLTPSKFRRDKRFKKPTMAALPTYGLGGVSVPERVVQEWKRRQHVLKASQKGHRSGTTQFTLPQEVNPHTGEILPPATIAGTDGNEVGTTIGGSGSIDRVDSRPPAGTVEVGKLLRRIRKMAPEDERGAWLLNNLLSKVSYSRRL